MNHPARGFTLIELSIVLVIIGLIVGGVLVGQDLVKTAAVRAQLSQIEKFHTATNTFYGKYGYLPGDITAALSTQLGFVTRAGVAGRGDGNGVLQGVAYTGGNPYGWNQDGETMFFWEDLSSAGLIEGTFNTATDANFTISSSSGFAPYLPAAKIGNGNYVYVWSNGPAAVASSGTNFFGIVVPTADGGGATTSNLGLTVRQAYAMDSKIDDGLPTTGRAIVASIDGSGGGWSLAASAVSDNATTCYNTTGPAYSIKYSNGSNVTCGLSFQFQ